MNASFDPTPPGDIERRSFEIIEAEVPEPRPFQGTEWVVVRRMIHATADFDLLHQIRFSPGAVQAGLQALGRGCLVLVDTEMARAGITGGRMQRLGCSVRCDLSDPRVSREAREQGRTRTATAVRLAAGELENAICVVGNAPTALNELLDLCRERSAQPALVVGMPVGFVGAAESKERLAAQDGIPFVTVLGRKGGSAAAAACVNALAETALNPGSTGQS
jgi:precorrin-8X/cobalt-precorrin-8 methylmutase